MYNDGFCELAQLVSWTNSVVVSLNLYKWFHEKTMWWFLWTCSIGYLDKHNDGFCELVQLVTWTNTVLYSVDVYNWFPGQTLLYFL